MPQQRGAVRVSAPKDDFQPDDFQEDDFQEDDFQEDTPIAASGTPSLGQIASGILQVEPIKGGLKSLGQTALAIPSIASKVLGVQEPQFIKSAREYLQPINPPQEMGATISRGLQMAAPALLTGGSSIPVQMAAGGVGNALVSAGEGESPLTSGIIGAASPAAGALASKAIPMLRGGAQRLVASAIGPAGAEKKELARVLPEITASKPFAFTRAGLQRQFETKATQAADAIDAAIDAKTEEGIRVNMNKATAGINQMVKQLKAAGGSVTPEGQQMSQQLTKVIGEMKELGRITAPYTKIGASVTETGLPPVIQKQTVGAALDKLRQLKQTYGEIVAGPSGAFSRGLSDASRAAAAKAGFRASQTAMVEAAPEIAALNRAYTVNATPRDIMANNAIRDIAGQKGGFGKLAEAGMLATGHPVAAIKLELLRGIMGSPGWKLVRANLKTAVANAIDSGNTTLAINLASHGLNELSRPPQITPP